MNGKYRKAIARVIEFLDPENEIAAPPANEHEALIRRGVIRELEEWSDWITDDELED